MRVGIIGHFGGKHIFNDGQTVKTVTLHDALKQRVPQNVRLQKIDTYYIRKNPVRFFLQFLSCMICDQKIIVLLSENGRKVLFPVLFILSKYLKKEIYHDCIAGKLAEEAAADLKFRKYISGFQSNWVESRSIRDELQKSGIANAEYIPNFKRLCTVREEDIPERYQPPYEFATFSRVMPEKGIEDAIMAVEKVNKDAGRILVKLHIYGPVKKGYEGRFEKCLESAHACEYKGTIPANESVAALKNYYMLLFPTTYRNSEGMPGTVVDAFSAGLPIIARRWRFCDEWIIHGVTGFVYDFDRPDKLSELIRYSIRHSDEIITMKHNCVKKAYEFDESSAVKAILKYMGIKNTQEKEAEI